MTEISETLEGYLKVVCHTSQSIFYIKKKRPFGIFFSKERILKTELSVLGTMKHGHMVQSSTIGRRRMRNGMTGPSAVHPRTLETVQAF